LLLIIAFIYAPLLSNLYYSTLNWRMGSTRASSAGIDNYVRLLLSSSGAEMWRVTVTFTVVTVLGSMVLGLAIALELNARIPGVTIARTACLRTVCAFGRGFGMVWNFIFDPQIGVLGYLLRGLGARSPEWYLDADLALIMVMIVYVWKPRVLRRCFSCWPAVHSRGRHGGCSP